MDRDSGVIELLQVLSEPAQTETESGFALPEQVYEQQQQKKHEALRRLARMQSIPAIRQMFHRINGRVPADGGTRDEVLRHAARFAVILLPAFQQAETNAAGLTSKEKFLNSAAESDPFLADSNLTRDAYSGQGDPEPDVPPKLDDWGNVRK